MKAINWSVPSSLPREYLDIVRTIAASQQPLVVRELASETGQPRISVTHRLRQLESRGYVTLHKPGERQALQSAVTAKGRELIGESRGIKVYGAIAAGALRRPEVAEVAEVLETLEDVFPNMRPGDFMLVVSGDSMYPEIWHGDRVLLRPDVKPGQGEITAVHIGDEAEATLKRYFEDEDGAVILHATNPAYEDIVVEESGIQVRIVGVFRGLVRLPKK